MRERRVPLRRSLIVRLLVTSVLVAIAAISATAWLAVQSTTRAIQQEQGRSLADDTSIYDALIEYAATHKSWDAVGPVVQDLAQRTGRRVTLMTTDRRTLADSGTVPSLASARPSAIVDPLQLDPGLARAADGTSIDPRAVGPYRLTAQERAALRRDADQQLACMRDSAVQGQIVDLPSGRPTVRVVTEDLKQVALQCGDQRLRQPVKSEGKALEDLNKLVNDCLGADMSRSLWIFPDFGYRFFPLNSRISDNDVRRCLEASRREQLKPHVAAAALLFVTDPVVGAEPPGINLSRENALRIAGVTGLVLLLAVAITVLVGVRLVRPLRALTEAARRPVDHQQRVPVTTRDEIGYLATALNDLSDRREQLEQQRKAMVSDVAHELRTPLTNIRSWLEAAQDGVTPVDPQLLELLLEEAVLLQHVIDDLRDLAAADAGNLKVHPESVYVNDALAQVVEAHRGAAETAGVHLATEVHGDPEVVVDPNRLRQMVGNLVSNAVRHTPRGGSVTLRSRVDGTKLIVDVVDTGVGIAPADLARVFDRFWRADGSRSRATGGSGLGLAIARKLAQAHGGDIGVTSRPGTGSVFTVRLPA